MTESPLLERHLRSLDLSAILASYRRLLGEHAQPLPYLCDLVALEVGKRHESGVRARSAAARFPTVKTIESFDFSLQAQLPKAKLLEHFEGTFVDAHRNLVLCGPPGTGKSPRRAVQSVPALGASKYTGPSVGICRNRWLSRGLCLPVTRREAMLVQPIALAANLG